MHWMKNIITHVKHADLSEKHSRKYRLICYISLELISACSAIVFLYSIAQLWFMVALVSTGLAIILINLWILSRTANTFLCGHLLTLITFTIITIASYMVWGIGSLHTQWYYVIPLLAAAIVGRSGLFIYSTLSLLIIIGFGKFSIPPFYQLPEFKLVAIEWVNHLFAYLILVTTLINLLHEQEQNEQKLNDRNYLLQAEKDKYIYLARFDPLTNLPNRRYFKQHLNDTIDSLSPNYYATIFFIDLDNFKYINDSYGHTIGDYVLLGASRRLQTCFRAGDFIARLGGDEFTAIVLHTPDENIAQLIAQRIIHEFEGKFKFEQIEFHCNISIGLATYPKDGQQAKDLIMKADRAMYAAKKINGSSYCNAASLLPLS
ncbi:MAG: GGDEF domain-containing protein [Legionella longbeachae]|nr:GGDEF domain-containing protein [Legionella longbeachae]